MSEDCLKRAREMFLSCGANKKLTLETYQEYQRLNVSSENEDCWRKEYLDRIMAEMKTQQGTKRMILFFTVYDCLTTSHQQFEFLKTELETTSYDDCFFSLLICEELKNNLLNLAKDDEKLAQSITSLVAKTKEKWNKGIFFAKQCYLELVSNWSIDQLNKDMWRRFSLL